MTVAWVFLAGLIVGGVLGVGAMCLLIMSRDDCGDCSQCGGYPMGDEAARISEEGR